ncbi:MAG: flagellar hook-associated protein FlgL [Gallionellaceae bacterium]|nr:flagellar hook-associated protein FlgL [Gallionellaceae bacterium]
MRISTASFYTASLPGIQSQQSAIARLNQQIASNQNYLAAKDNPVKTNQIMALADSIAMRNQHLANIDKAGLVLSEENTVLSEMRSAVSSVKSLLSQSSSMSDQSLRSQMAQQLGDLYIHIKDLANAKDSNGNYIFAGYKTDTLPYDHSQAYPGTVASASTTYGGDAGVRAIEIDTGRTLPVSDVLNTIFQIGGTPDLLQAIDQAAVDLADPTVTQPGLAGNLQGYLDVVNTSFDRLSVTVNDVVGRQVVLDDAKNVQKTLKLNDLNALGGIQELDQAAAIVELQQRQVALQASMQAFSKVSGLSLFSYL